MTVVGKPVALNCCLMAILVGFVCAIIITMLMGCRKKRMALNKMSGLCRTWAEDVFTAIGFVDGKDNRIDEKQFAAAAGVTEAQCVLCDMTGKYGPEEKRVLYTQRVCSCVLHSDAEVFSKAEHSLKEYRDRPCNILVIMAEELLMPEKSFDKEYKRLREESLADEGIIHELSQIFGVMPREIEWRIRNLKQEGRLR